MVPAALESFQVNRLDVGALRFAGTMEEHRRTGTRRCKITRQSSNRGDGINHLEPNTARYSDRIAKQIA